MEKFVCHITRGPEHPFGLLLVTIAKIPNLTEDDLKTRKVFYVRASIKPTNKQVNPLARLEGRSEDWELTFHDDNAFIAIPASGPPRAVAIDGASWPSKGPNCFNKSIYLPFHFSILQKQYFIFLVH